MPDGADEAQVRDAAAGGMPLVDPRLAIWLSPSFPVGAYAYSHGLEWAAHHHLIHDRATLAAWLADLIEHGSGRNDLILLAHAADALARNDYSALADINDLALALQPSAERHLESRQQGGSFLAILAQAWPTPQLEPAMRAVGDAAAYPIAIGIAVAAHAIALRPALTATAMAFVSNLVSAAIRLSVVGQTDAQHVIADLFPLVIKSAALAQHATLDELGSSVFRSDIASISHETMYSRLFRS